MAPGGFLKFLQYLVSIWLKSAQELPVCPKEDKRMGREGLLGVNQGFAGLRTFKEKGGTNGHTMYYHRIKISGKY